MQHHMLARCGGGSDPCAGGGLILLHKRTAGAEALPIWTSADPDFFSAPEAPWRPSAKPVAAVGVAVVQRLERLTTVEGRGRPRFPAAERG